MKAKALQIQGTGSGVGKSVIVSALCRIFLQDGYKVAPFKAQNMALNSFVTKEAGEIGRAQATQAMACRIEPSVHMNPVLIKPSSDTGAQIIVRGKPVGNMNALRYAGYKKKLTKRVFESFDRLAGQYEIVVIEGAGSPAEINLKPHDIVNMKMAQYAKAPVIIAGDIDKGGVFAFFVGTMELLMPSERKRVKGFIINKFRGDKSLLESGIRFLEKKTKRPVLGVIPYFKDIRIPEEDSVALENSPQSTAHSPQSAKKINIAVVKLPYISNFTDFDALENEPDVKLEYISDKNALNGSDIIIIPGTKNTIADLIWLKKTGFADKILSAIRYPCLAGRQALNAILIGICGGYQMLGRFIYDPDKVESAQKKVEGLGLLSIGTTFKPKKILSQVNAVEIESGIELKGYEIHHGRTINLDSSIPVFRIKQSSRLDGMRSESGNIWGAYLHGIFENDVFRREFLNRIRLKRGLRILPKGASSFDIDNELDKLAGLVRQNLDMKLLYRILNSR